MPGWGLLTEGGLSPKKLHEVDLKVTLNIFSIMNYTTNYNVINNYSTCYTHLQIIWMKECRENFKYKKSWISSKMICTYKYNRHSNKLGNLSLDPNKVVSNDWSKSL